MKKLALFDVDGTLTESNQLDSECYVDVVKRVLGIDSFDDDWSHYQHVTDAGVLAEIYRAHFHKEIPEQAANEFKEEFLREIKSRLLSSNTRLQPLPGAREAVRTLQESGEWVIALAGGAWRDSIKIKLQSAKIKELDGVPIFSSDDSVSRTEIMEKAVNTMLSRTGIDIFKREVYLGDAIWDLKASQDLGMAFLGVGERSEELLALGASHAVRDYSDLEEFMYALEHCSAPGA